MTEGIGRLSHSTIPIQHWPSATKWQATGLRIRRCSAVPSAPERTQRWSCRAR